MRCVRLLTRIRIPERFRLGDSRRKAPQGRLPHLPPPVEHLWVLPACSVSSWSSSNREDEEMKERVAGARGQSADGNYMSAHGWGQSTKTRFEGAQRAQSSEKRRPGGGYSGFWWF